MEKAPLMIDYFSIGHIECQSVRWEKNSVYPILLLDLSINVRPYGEKNLPVTLFNLEGEVLLEDNKIIGRVIPISGPLLFPSALRGEKEYITTLRIDLDSERVILIEDYRRRGNSKLKVNLSVVAYINKEFGKGTTSINVEIPEEKWQKIEKKSEPILSEEEASIGDLTNQYSLKNLMAQMTAIVQRKLIIEVLSKTNWNRRKAAELLGISYRSLLYKIKEYKISE